MPNPTPTDLREIARWLTRLSGITRQPADNPLSRDTLADLARMLGGEFPVSAFTTGSLAEVAAGQEWFPAYATIRQRVGVWWEANRPTSAPAPTVPEGIDLAGEDLLWFNFWHARLAEIAGGQIQPRPGHPRYSSADDARANLASLVRSQSPKAWRVISGADDRGRVVPSDADHDAVRERVATLTAEMEARGNDGTARSHSFGEAVAALGAGVKPTAQRGQLTAEQLAADRAKRGIAPA